MAVCAAAASGAAAARRGTGRGFAFGGLGGIGAAVWGLLECPPGGGISVRVSGARQGNWGVQLLID